MAEEGSESRRFHSDEVRLGYVSGVFGLRGELKLFLYNPASDLLEIARDVTLVSPEGARRMLLLQARPGAGRRIIGMARGIGSVEESEALVGWEIVLPKEALPPAEEDEYYLRDMIGLPVRTRSGRDLGRLAEIHSVSEVDTWVIRGPRQEFYLPALKELVLVVRPGVEIIVDDDVGEPI